MENQVQKIKKTCGACQSDNTSFFVNKNNYDIYRCADCGTIFISDIPHDTSGIYNEEYFWGAEDGFGYVDYDSDKEPSRKAMEKAFFDIEKSFGGKGRILDIGSATGFFLKIAKNNGWKVKGVEIGKEATQVANKNGIETVCGQVFDIKDEKFNAITMFDIIEHVQDPEKTLSYVYGLLEEGGVLAINTPNASSLFARFTGKKWHLIVPPEHIVCFSEKGLELILKRVGFKVVKKYCLGKSFTIEYILHTLYRWQGLKIWGLILNIIKKAPFLSGLRLPLNLRDNIFLIAKKDVK
jgi:2-polyprenyl-3-methyl-5-hydroxy-6-metoxy-1,4-benzoquinol methylase